MHTKNPFVPPGIDQPPENKGFKKKEKPNAFRHSVCRSRQEPRYPMHKKRPEIV